MFTSKILQITNSILLKILFVVFHSQILLQILTWKRVIWSKLLLQKIGGRVSFLILRKLLLLLFQDRFRYVIFVGWLFWPWFCVDRIISTTFCMIDRFPHFLSIFFFAFWLCFGLLQFRICIFLIRFFNVVVEDISILFERKLFVVINWWLDFMVSDNLFFFVRKLWYVRVIQGLCCCQSLVRIEFKQLCDKIHSWLTYTRIEPFLQRLKFNSLYTIYHSDS